MLDERTLGLRGLICLAAMPGIGKTSLLLQLGLNVLRHNQDAVVLFISLEMAKNELYTRLLCNQARMDWKTVMLGSASLRGQPDGAWFTPHDSQRLTVAHGELHETGLDSRIFIIDQQVLGGDFTAATILAHLEAAKAATQTSRALIVIDYLQLVPAPDRVDLDADRYRVDFLKDLVNGTMTDSNPAGDCVFVISEMRKPSGKGQWHGKLADLMGSARLPYALAACFTFRRVEEEGELCQYNWVPVGIDHPIRVAFEEAEVAPIMLEMVKGRDGFQKGSIALAFEYTRSQFVEISRIGHHSGHSGNGPTGHYPNGLPPLVHFDPFGPI